MSNFITLKNSREFGSVYNTKDSVANKTQGNQID